MTLDKIKQTFQTTELTADEQVKKAVPNKVADLAAVVDPTMDLVEEEEDDEDFDPEEKEEDLEGEDADEEGEDDVDGWDDDENVVSRPRRVVKE
jgi:hypothetical protein